MSLRARLAPALRPVRDNLAFAGRSRRRLRYFRDGIEGICVELRNAIDCGPILREFGATVGPHDSIHGPLYIWNAPGDFRHLTFGHHAYIAPGVLIDLTDTVTIADYVAIGPGSHLITHIDVGESPLKQRRPRKHGPILIEEGAYLGVGVTVLHGVTIGREATIGANSLIRHDVPAGATYVSPDARPAPGP